MRILESKGRDDTATSGDTEIELFHPTRLSKREYYAAQALKTFGSATFGWITDQTDMDRILEERARISFKQADAMIKASERS